MEKAFIVWLGFALICVTVEVLSPMFGFILIGGAALVAAVFGALHYSVLVQVLAFGCGAVLSLTVLRTRIMGKLSSAPGVPSRTDRLIGKKGRVTEAIDPVSGLGRIVVDGHDWAAQASQALPPGADVVVESADGIRLKVAPI